MVWSCPANWLSVIPEELPSRRSHAGVTSVGDKHIVLVGGHHRVDDFIRLEERAVLVLKSPGKVMCGCGIATKKSLRSLNLLLSPQKFPDFLYMLLVIR